jgi:hypothetical protein
MSYELPEMEVVEVHYFTVLIKDEFDPKGREWIERYDNKERAERQLQHFRNQKLTRS